MRATFLGPFWWLRSVYSRGMTCKHRYLCRRELKRCLRYLLFYAALINCSYILPPPRANALRPCFLGQVILWDKVVKSAEEAHLMEKDMTVKYGLIDEVKSREYKTAVLAVKRAAYDDSLRNERRRTGRC